MRRNVLTLLAAIGLLQLGSSAAAQPRQAAFETRFSKFVDRIQADPSAPPAFALMVIEGDRTLFERLNGPRDMMTGAPLTLDSPLYTASVTKSHVGLLAAQLDAKGVLPLNATFRDVWPNLTLPYGLDFSQVTARSALAHVSWIEAPAIQWRYSDTGEYRTADMTALLPRFAVRANRAYDYGNIGPVMYSAMAESRTGRSWRDLLQDHVARPLGLTRTSARLEDFAPSEVARCNARQRGGWRPMNHKPTALLDAGAGVYSSARDLGTYLRAFTSDARSTGGAIRPEVLRRTYAKASSQKRDFLGFERDGYGLGWDLSLYDGHRVVSRSGGYSGCRSFIAFLPEHGFGVVAFALADAGANQFNVTLIQQAIDFWSGHRDADKRAATRLTEYAAAAARAVREADAVPAVPRDRRQHALPAYVGWYRAEGFGRLAVSLRPHGLEVEAGVLRLLLAPRGERRFAAHNADLPIPPWDLTFEQGADGRVESLTIEGILFRRDQGKE